MKIDPIKVPLSNGMNLIVDVYGAEPNCNNDEISISIIDSEGIYMQDIVCVREAMYKRDTIEAMVYSNEWDEDYTHKFEIPIYNDEEKEE